MSSNRQKAGCACRALAILVQSENGAHRRNTGTFHYDWLTFASARASNPPDDAQEQVSEVASELKQKPTYNRYKWNNDDGCNKGAIGT